MKTTELVKIGNRELSVSNTGKVFYPQTGFTKGEMLKYYVDIAPAMLPHLKDRPLSFKRYPDGVEGLSFFEKNCPSHRPEWVETTAVWSEQKQANTNYCVINELPALVWAANLGVIEFHSSLSKKDKIETPTMMVFDLDPGEGARIVECCQAGLWVRDALEAAGLECFAKTSGSKGLQLYAPLNSKASYEQTKTLAHELALELEREHPDQIVSKMAKVLRKGKVFIDWSQNDPHKTTVCAYSMRAKPVESASTPVKWGEVRAALKKRSPDLLKFTPAQVVKRVQCWGDLFEPVVKLKQRIQGSRFKVQSS
ncbi:MAG TPA: non-homologous end-joining DNA ligase [Planctomycetota bacterium]|nr:non-homologous end-joining DNA ligase [Planctomycetota bacterium]